MSIKKYLTFHTVVECGSVTAAAIKLGHSQSGVTQLLNALEADLGVTLLSRGRNGITLTPDGEKLYPLICDVLKSDMLVTEAAAELSEKKSNETVKIASFTSVAVNWLPQIIKDFSNEEPDVNIELTDIGYNDIEKAIVSRMPDCAFVSLPVKLDCETIPLYQDRLLAVLPEDFDLTKLGGKLKFPVSLFESEAVVSLTNTIDRDARSIFEANNVKPNIRYRVQDDYAQLAMVEKGLGICIMPELLLKDTKRHVITMELEPPAFRTIGIACPNYKHASSAVIKFVEFTKRYCK